MIGHHIKRGGARQRLPLIGSTNLCRALWLTSLIWSISSCNQVLTESEASEWLIGMTSQPVIGWGVRGWRTVWCCGRTLCSVMLVVKWRAPPGCGTSCGPANESNASWPLTAPAHRQRGRYVNVCNCHVKYRVWGTRSTSENRRSFTSLLRKQ